MTKAKKTKQPKIEEIQQIEKAQILEQPMDTAIAIQDEIYEQCEWCFQFDEDKPQVFAWTNEDMAIDEKPNVTLTVTNTKNSYITFTSKDGKLFKLFCRELTEEGKKLRATQVELLKNELENESKNKEA